MRRTRTGLFVLGAALLALGGCASDSHLQAKRPEHEYVLPPTDDPRFSTYPKFPEKTLNNWPKKEPDSDFGKPMNGLPRTPTPAGRFSGGGPTGAF